MSIMATIRRKRTNKTRLSDRATNRVNAEWYIQRIKRKDATGQWHECWALRCKDKREQERAFPRYYTDRDAAQMEADSRSRMAKRKLIGGL